MQLMLVAPRAVLLPLNALGMDPAVLGGEIVPVFALVAGEDNLVSGHLRCRYGMSDVACERKHSLASTPHPLCLKDEDQ
jgi:hypothetical protein